ncbi:MAG: hypothetical protein NVSMB3_04900 [Acidobacteriaceae bacterium]
MQERYGTLEDFAERVTAAVRHGIRVLVELRPGVRGAALSNDARFWLNHGVTGLALDADDPEQTRAMRSLLRGAIGERVLIASHPSSATSPSSSETRASQPDLVRVLLPPLSQGVPAMRAALQQTQSRRDARDPVPLLSAQASGGDAASARALATLLLGSGGAVLLRADDLDLPHASSTASETSIFHWYRQWSGLHRGNPVLRSGDDTLLDHDVEGALVWVRQTKGSRPPIVFVCNLSGRPLRLSLVSDLDRLRLRGSFLRTLARSDGGMGAMPLRDVALPASAVYVGELSR